MEMRSLSTQKLPCELQLVLLRSFKKWRLCEGLRSIDVRKKFAQCLALFAQLRGGKPVRRKHSKLIYEDDVQYPLMHHFEF